MATTKVLKNAVIDFDLYMVMLNYTKHNNIKVDDNISMSKVIEIAHDSIDWLSNQVSKVDNIVMYGFDDWYTLYYAMLSYAQEFLLYKKTFHQMTKEELIDVANNTIKWLNSLIDTIHKPTIKDLKYII